MIRFVHGINLVDAPADSELASAQAIALETIRHAREFSRADIEVKIVGVPDPGWTGNDPAGIRLTPPLNRTVADLHSFRRNRPLPLLADILHRIHSETTADYMIFSNADIAVMPFFYASLAGLIEQEYDALVVNRRTIPDRPHTTEALPFMYATIGSSHPGYDCFVFQYKQFPRFHLGRICVGTAWVGRALLTNMICFSNRFREFRDLHLTFHLGDEQSWRSGEFSDYLEFNHAEFLSVFAELERDCSRLSLPDWRSYCLDTGEKRGFPEFCASPEVKKQK